MSEIQFWFNDDPKTSEDVGVTLNGERFTLQQMLETTLRQGNQLAEAQGQSELNESQRNAAIDVEKMDAAKAMSVLAGTHFCTPEEGYDSNTSWAISDLCRAVSELHQQSVETRSQLAFTRLERDNRTSAYEIAVKTIHDLRQQLAASREREKKLTDALETIYDKWENGDRCYEDPEAFAGYLGNAFKLSEEEENVILALIPADPSGDLRSLPEKNDPT